MKGKQRMSRRDWIVGEGGVVALLDGNIKRIENSPLPPMNEWVEVLMFDGHSFAACRTEGFEPGCGWIWKHDTGWMVAGHPLLVCWRPLDV